MTATLSPSSAALPERSLRMLSIAANLLPQEITDARRTRKIRLVVVSAVAALVAVVAAWYGLASYQTSAAESEVTAAQDRASQLRTRQTAFKELATTQIQTTAIQAELRQLMKADQRWADVLASLQAATPAGVKLTVVNAALTSGKPVAGAAAGTTLPNTSGETLVGTIKLSGSAPDKAAVSAYVTKLRTALGVANPELISAISGDTGGITFTVDADVTAKVAGTRFTSKGGK
jgi:Tfp pilus assembly protein PilN